MQISEISNSVNFTCEPDPLNEGSSQAAARALVQPSNGSAQVWRAPHVRELRPEEPERVRSEPKCLTAKSTGRRHELVFLHAKDLANAIATKLGGDVLAAGKGWKCRCPAHADNEPSLHLEDSKSGLVLASCFPCGNDPASQSDLVAAIADLGYALSPPREDLRSGDMPAPKPPKRIIAVYDYLNALGELIFQVVRSDPKDFRQRRPDGKGGHLWNVAGCPALPYRLPEVLEAVSTGVLVFILEGEKDVNTAFDIGLLATCNARGAGKWTDGHSEHLRGADVVLIPDNDQPGRDHIAKVANSLRATASRIRIVELKGAKDLSDWIAAGHTADELMRLVEAAKTWDRDAPAKPDPTPANEHVEEAEGETPDMSIVRRNQIPAPTFPLDVLGPAGDWVKASAESKSAPIDYVALVLIATAGGMIGAKIRVTPWEGWQEAIVIWAALIGPPSFSKSPSADDIREAVRIIERELNQDWDMRQGEYEQKTTIAEARRAAWEHEITAALKVNKERVDLPQMPDIAMPKPPTKARLWIVDSTTEKVARLLGENPGGLICFRDELAGLLGGFDKYGGSGNDRSFWIEAHGGRPYRYDRVGLRDGAIDIPFNAVALIGGIQPDRLNSMMLSGDDDGLAARPIYAWPDQVRSRRPSGVADNTKMVAALRRLSAITFQAGGDGSIRPRIVALEADAADEFQAWYEGIQWDAKLGASGKLAGAVGKLDGALLRVALVFEYLSWAWSRSNTPEPEHVSLLSVMNAKRYIDEWVRPNLERVFAEASLPEAQRDARTVGLWLLKTRPKEINARELRRLPGFTGPKDAKELDAALEMLVDARWLIPPQTTGGIGRRRKDFVVNEAIYEAPLNTAPLPKLSKQPKLVSGPHRRWLRGVLTVLTLLTEGVACGEGSVAR